MPMTTESKLHAGFLVNQHAQRTPGIINMIRHQNIHHDVGATGQLQSRMSSDMSQIGFAI